MTRWRPSGYAPTGLFPGANSCRFRIVHTRDDGLVVMTVGDQRSRGGALSPVYGGFYFMTLVGRVPERGDPEIEARYEHADADTAGVQHVVRLDEWEDEDA